MLVLAMLAGMAAYAQEPPLPPVERLAPGLGKPGTVLVSGIQLTGNQHVGSEELSRLADKLQGREVAVGEIEALRHAISEFYFERGYINSGAVYEEPAVVDGVLRLRVIEGRVTDFRVSGNGRLDAGYLTSRLAHGDEILDLGVLRERYQLLLADPLVERLDVVVEPGRTLGEAALAVDVVRARPWMLSAFANNYRSVSTGEAVAGLQGVLRNLTGLGDALDAELQFSRGAQRNAVGWRLPLGASGAQLSLRHDDGDARVVEAPLDDADVESRVEAFEVELSKALVERLDRRSSLALAYAERRNTTTIFGQPFSFNAGEAGGISRVRVWRFAQEFMFRDAVSVLALRSTFSAGQCNAMVDDPDNAQVFPARHFSYWLGQAQYRWRPAAAAWRIEARIAVQKAQDTLVPLERFAIGGQSTVRGYRENSLVRDNGYAAGLEWHAPPFEAVSWLDLFVFYDSGAAWNRNQDPQRLRGLGLGFSARYQGLRADLAWAHNIDSRAPVGERGLQDQGIHLALSYSF